MSLEQAQVMLEERRARMQAMQDAAANADKLRAQASTHAASKEAELAGLKEQPHMQERGWAWSSGPQAREPCCLAEVADAVVSVLVAGHSVSSAPFVRR